jgi:hypothetical protein
MLKPSAFVVYLRSGPLTLVGALTARWCAIGHLPVQNNATSKITKAHLWQLRPHHQPAAWR